MRTQNSYTMGHIKEDNDKKNILLQFTLRTERQFLVKMRCCQPNAAYIECRVFLNRVSNYDGVTACESFRVIRPNMGEVRARTDQFT